IQVALGVVEEQLVTIAAVQTAEAQKFSQHVLNRTHLFDSLKYGSKTFRNASRARCSRLFTAGTLDSVASAISASDIPSTSDKSTVERYGSANASIAVRTRSPNSSRSAAASGCSLLSGNWMMGTSLSGPW